MTHAEAVAMVPHLHADNLRAVAIGLDRLGQPAMAKACRLAADYMSPPAQNPDPKHLRVVR